MTELYTVEHQAFRKGWEVIKSIPIVGDGVQAPGAVTMCKTDGPYPYMIHFFNAQDGGFHNGDYWQTRKAAEEAYVKRAMRFISFQQD
jgi:hypothetical protein